MKSAKIVRMQNVGLTANGTKIQPSRPSLKPFMYRSGVCGKSFNYTTAEDKRR